MIKVIREGLLPIFLHPVCFVLCVVDILYRKAQRGIRRVALALLVLAVAMLTYPGALLASLATRLTPAPPALPGPRGALAWLHVAHPAGGIPFIADDQGRLVLLHGAIPASLLEFGPGTGPVYPLDPSAYANRMCPANSAASRYPPLRHADLYATARPGVNSICLPSSSSHVH